MEDYSPGCLDQVNTINMICHVSCSPGQVLCRIYYIWLYLSVLLMFSFAITKYSYIMKRFNSVPDAVG